MLLFVISIAAVYDIKTWEIPNTLIVIGIAAGSLVSIMTEGFSDGLKNSVFGIVVPVALLFILFILKLMGAGDIKLFSVAGAFVGISIFKVLLYAFISGGIISILYIVKKIFLSVTRRVTLTDDFAEEIVKTNGTYKYKNRIHFSVAILAGVLYYMVTEI